MRYIILMLFVLLSFCSNAQEPDSGFVTMITSVSWMQPEMLLMTAVKFDKAGKVQPISKTFICYVNQDKLEPLFAGNTPDLSPDGKIFVYSKKMPGNKADICLFDRESMKETVLLADTFYKSSPSWSPNGKKILYNLQSNGQGKDATIDVYVYDLETRENKKVTESCRYKSYNPVWSPSGDKITYYLEKGDNRDQIYITDASGSFHRNITNDTSSHNYYPSWIDNNTIIYTSAPDNIFTIHTDGTNKQKVDGIHSFFIRYDPRSRLAAYITKMPAANLMLYDWGRRISKTLVTQEMLKNLF